MTQILIDCGLLKRIGRIKSRGRAYASGKPELNLEEIDASSEDCIRARWQMTPSCAGAKFASCLPHS